MRVSVLLLLAVSACPKASPAPTAELPPAPPPAINVPAGCLADLAGAYIHADDATFLYSARDDGGTLELSAMRSFADGGSGAPTIRLRRGPDGFVGETHALAGLPSGATCEVTFPTRVKACGAEGLTLESASTGSVGEGCATPARPRNAVMLEHKLTRADAGGKRLSQ